MDRNVRLGDGENARNPLRAEAVKRLPDHGSAHIQRRRQHRLTYVAQVIQQGGVTVPQFQQNMIT